MKHCESINENNPSISAIDGTSEIREIDQEWCLYEDCYATGNAPVCSKAGDKTAKVTLCYFDESDSTLKEKCEDPWWRPSKGGDTLNNCGTCDDDTRRLQRNKKNNNNKKKGPKGSGPLLRRKEV